MIAYDVSVHKNPEQVSRLMHAIYSPEDLYYINIFGVDSDKKRAEWMDYLKSFEKSNVSFIFRHSNAWGTFGLVKATIDAMEHFKSSNYSYFINLSGQCYPIKSTRSIKEVLSKSSCSYVDFHKMLGYTEYEKDKKIYCPPTTRFHYRFEYCYYPIPNWGPIEFLQGLRNLRKDTTLFIKIPRLNKKMLRSFDLYVGSMWFCLYKGHVKYILDFIKNNPDYIKLFSTVLIPDEHFFQTILLNSPFKSQIVNDNLRYLVWPGPQILRTKNINGILNSEKFFARKFDTEIDSNILDLLDLNNQNSRLCV
ncbi:MAG: beta-1,6-N-acetylglucosaminyltransferase [Halobacteriota archaeon]